jgi:hypothetical protein
VGHSTHQTVCCWLLQAGNPDHMKMVKDMGISILTLPDGRVQLLHSAPSVSTHITISACGSVTRCQLRSALLDCLTSVDKD